MESWKFNLLIEHAQTPRHLHNFDNWRYGYPTPLFLFNHCKKGIVEGKFNTKSSSIQVICHGDMGYQDIEDTANFIIDSSYILCLYTTLKKLKEDKARFTSFIENADTTIGNRDEFDNIFKHIQ
jgi:hypothetical protein